MIYNFGSTNIDYVYGVQHFVTEGETKSAQTMDVFPGGKGLNQSIAIARAQASVQHLGCVSKSAVLLLDTMKEAKVQMDHLQLTEAENGHAIIQVDEKGDNCILIYGGSNDLVQDDYLRQTAALFQPGDILVVQNEMSKTAHMMCLAKEKNVTIVLNPSPMDERCLQLPLELVDVFILNEGEGNCIAGEKNTAVMLETLKNRFPCAQIILTMGARGSRYISAEHDIFVDAIPPSKVVDTTAAGDTYLGFFVASLSKKLSEIKCMQMATAAASLSVTKKGAATSIPSLQEVEDLFAAVYL